MERFAYPIAAIQDRYGGTYSRGDWIALAAADNPKLGGGLLAGLGMNSRGDGPWGDDGEAMDFWAAPPDFVAVGNTPDKAIETLLRHGWWTDYGRAEQVMVAMLPASDRQGICPSEVAKRLSRSNWEHHLGEVMASVGRYGPDETECIASDGEVLEDFWKATSMEVTSRGIELHIGDRMVVVRIRRRITPRRIA